MFGSPVVAIVALTLAFAFIYAGIKNQSIVDVLTGKEKTKADFTGGILGGAIGPLASGAGPLVNPGLA